MMDTSACEALFQESCKLMPGGVSSPVRSFHNVKAQPFFVDRAAGSRLTDVDGNSYIDYVLGFGALALGHCHEDVRIALEKQLHHGTIYGACTKQEIDLSKQIIADLPSVEMVRFLNSGTEAAITAVRIARAATKRTHIIKFAGCYHGHGDQFLVSAGSGALSCGIPDSEGVSEHVASQTLIVDYNDIAGVKAVFENAHDRIAAVIVEPVAGNMGLIPPKEGFLETLRAECTRFGALLIFDEVMTGWRISLNGAQGHFSVSPDLTLIGKIPGGGLPIGGVCGPRNLLEYLAPVGPVYQAGTFSGNPLTMTAGLRTLRVLHETDAYDRACGAAFLLSCEIASSCRAAGLPFSSYTLGSMWGFSFSEKFPENLKEAQQAQTEFYPLIFASLIKDGIFIPPSPFESLFTCSAHSEEDIEKTLKGFKKFCERL